MNSIERNMLRPILLTISIIWIFSAVIGCADTTNSSVTHIIQNPTSDVIEYIYPCGKSNVMIERIKDGSLWMDSSELLPGNYKFKDCHFTITTDLGIIGKGDSN